MIKVGMTINIVFNFTQIALCIVSVILLLNKVFGYDIKVKKLPLIIVSMMFAALTVFVSLTVSNSDDIDLFTELSGLFGSIIYSHLFFKPETKTIFLKFGLAICAVYDFIVLSICSMFSVQSLIINRFTYCLVYLAIAILAVVAGRYLKGRIPEGFLNSIPTMMYVVIFFASLSAFYDITSLIDSAYSASIASAIRLILSALVCFCIVNVAFRYSDLIGRQREAELQLEMELKHYEEMTRKNREIRSFRHDYKNNLTSLRFLIETNSNQEALEYIDNLNAPLEKTRNKFVTGNYLADAILGEKSNQAELQDITLDFNGTIPQTGITNNDLCTIITNGLDNAVRGCEGCTPCNIRVESRIKGNWFNFVIKNPVKNKVQIKNNAVKTSKSDKENHGFGLENIKRVAKKYDGRVELACDDIEFTLKVFMMLEGV